MNIIKTHLCLAAAALLGTMSAAQAGFLFENAPAPAPQTAGVVQPQPAPPAAPQVTPGRDVDMSAKVNLMAKRNRQKIDLESRLTSRMTQSGDPPGELPIIRGMGRDVTFEDALRQILPAGWSAYSDQDLPLDQKLSWNGSRTWPMVLNTLLVDRDMRANIDWKNREVMFFVPALKVDPTKGIVPGAPGVEVRAASAEPTGPAAPAAAGSPPPAPPVKEVVWTLSPDHTLRENLRRWASAANWNLVWNAVNGDSVVDYPVDAKVEFSGELLGGYGAMAKVITAYRDADYPLEIEFFRGNRVVEVRLHRVPDVKSTPEAAPVMAPPRLAPPPPQRVPTAARLGEATYLP